jgi:hypothetical protein
MKAIARYPNRHEADLAAGFLEDAGITAVVRSDDASGWEPGLTFVESVWIYVAHGDQDQAMKVLRDLGGLVDG